MAKQPEIQTIDYAVIPKPHTPMYLMHKYWARKPYNVVSEYINHYSKEGDVVLDPFAGSGVTALEALKSNRKAIAIDLNPISIFLIENTLTFSHFKESEIIDHLNNIQEKVKSEINKLYQTTCPSCKHKSIILATIWNREKNEPIELRCLCSFEGKRYSTKPTSEDLKTLKEIDKLTPRWFPDNRLAYNGNYFLKREGKETISELFTKRNLYCLSIILNEIEKIENKKMENLFKLAFTSMAHLASKMCPVAKEGGKGHWSALSATSFWALQSFWTPPIFMESNVWMLFESAIKGKQGLLKAKADEETQIKNYKKAKSFSDLKDGANILLENASALELTKYVPKNSVDYIFTDPPYGGAVQYFELSTLWASWLRFDLDYSDEVTINKEQNKDFDYYHKMLKSAFREMYQVLKPNKYLTVTFHSTDIAVWNSIIKAVVLAGFDLEKIVYQPPARTSAKGLLQPYGSAVGDYFRLVENIADDATLVAGHSIDFADSKISSANLRKIVELSRKARGIEDRAFKAFFSRDLKNANNVIREAKEFSLLCSSLEKELKKANAPFQVGIVLDRTASIASNGAEIAELVIDRGEGE